MLKRFNSNSKRIIYLSALQMFMVALSGIFLNIFILQKTSSGFWLALYNLFLFIFLFASFYIGSRVASKKGVKNLMRLAFLLYFLWLSFMLFISPLIAEMQELVVIVGIFSGLANGFYWSGMNSLKSFGIDKEELVEFTGVIGSVNSMLNFLAPVLATLFLFAFGDAGYFVIFSLALVIVVIGFFVSLNLENYIVEEDFRIADRLKLSRDYKNNFLVTFCFFDSVRGSISYTIMPMILLATYQTDLMVGVYTAYSGLVAVIAYLIGIRAIRRIKQERLTILAYVLLMSSSILFAITLDPTVGIIFATINNFATPIILMITWTIIVDICRPTENSTSRFYASMTIREFYNFVGRFVGTFLIVLLGYHVDELFQVIYILSELLLMLILFLVLRYQWKAKRESRKQKKIS